MSIFSGLVFLRQSGAIELFKYKANVKAHILQKLHDLLQAEHGQVNNNHLSSDK